MTSEQTPFYEAQNKQVLTATSLQLHDRRREFCEASTANKHNNNNDDDDKWNKMMKRLVPLLSSEGNMGEVSDSLNLELTL